jgi:nucleoside-diphosphate-sugar epimerase
MPEYVLLAAARVGGILVNNAYPAKLIADNSAIQTNVLQAAYKFGVGRLLFLGSSCIYPRDCSSSDAACDPLCIEAALNQDGQRATMIGVAGVIHLNVTSHS